MSQKEAQALSPYLTLDTNLYLEQSSNSLKCFVPSFWCHAYIWRPLFCLFAHFPNSTTVILISSC